mgnify:CR=1 FL=1
MEHPLARVEVEINGKTAMVDGGMQQKPGARCLLCSDLIGTGQVPGPKVYMAWTIWAVPTRAQTRQQPQNWV